jgi:hypothetical protein
MFLPPQAKPKDKTMNLWKLTRASVAALALVGMNAFAAGMFDPVSGVLLGNICRSGPYYTFIAFDAVGNACWNGLWNMPGTVSTY